jgi:uncharacterized protein YkwD
MAETAPTGSGPNRSGPFLWLLAIGLVGALVGAGLLIRSVSDDDVDAESISVAAVASVTPTATPTATSSETPTPTGTATATPAATEDGTPEATESTTPTPAAESSPEPSVAAAPAPPPPPPAEDPTASATAEPIETQTPEATPEATTAPPPPQGDAGAESYAYGETDRVRGAAGLSGLATNGSLTAVARSWSDSMRTSGVLSHNPSAPNQIPSGWTRWAENVAHASTITEAMSLLENSPLHYKNITYANFTDIGIGVVVDSDGWVWVTQLFAQY